jgi:hypothetical protein
MFSLRNKQAMWLVRESKLGYTDPKDGGGVPALLAPCPEFVCCKPVGGFFILRAPRLRGTNFTSIFVSICLCVRRCVYDAESEGRQMCVRQMRRSMNGCVGRRS